MAKRTGAKKEAAPPPDEAGDDLHSIGDLAEAAGIGVDTIRAWERRYGRPKAIRLPSGHRRYTDEDVRWLRRMAEALALGHRPRKVVHLSDAQLDDLLAPAPPPPREAATIVRLLELLRAYRIADLRRDLLRDARRLGTRSFLRERMAPLVTAVGRAWADAEIDIRHEHLLTQVVEDVLRSLRLDLPTPRKGPLVVLATLPGELHGLGLLMVAIECRLAAVRTHNLGPQVPLDQIVSSARDLAATAVALSISLATGGVATDRTVAELRKQLPRDVDLIVGGAGARGVRRGPVGVRYLESWDALEDWLSDLVHPRRGKGKQDPAGS